MSRGAETGRAPRVPWDAPGWSANRRGIQFGLRRERSIGKYSIDLGCVAVLAIAVLVQGIVVALGLPHRVELLADLAVVGLLLWIVLALVRSGAAIPVPYLAIALLGILVIAALRSDDLVRLVVSARNFLLLPALALGLAALGPSERRNRAVLLTVIALVVVEFVVTIGQALTVSDLDLVDGTFGDHSDPSTAFAIVAGACVALGIYAARAGRTWWLALVVVLPVFSVWAAIRAVVPIVPIAGLSVAVASWWVCASTPVRRERWRLPMTVAATAVLCSAAVVGSWAIARPQELKVLLNPIARNLYLSNANIYAHTQAHGWTTVKGQFDPHSATAREVRKGKLPTVTPLPGAAYAGAIHDRAVRLAPGTTYSFLAAVRVSAPGTYHLFAGPYARDASGGTFDAVGVGANRWTWLRMQGVTARGAGQPFFALQRDSGAYAGDESISINCPMAFRSTAVAEPATGGKPDCALARKQAKTRAVTATRAPAHLGRRPPRVPGRGTQYKTAARLIDGNPVSFLFGNGLGATTYAANLGVSKPPHDERIAGYSDFGTLVVELGWLGTAIAAACALALGLGSLAAARRAAPGTWTRALLIGYPGVLVTMIATVFFGTPFRNIGSTTLFWILTGLALASILEQRGRRGGVTLRRRR